MFQATRSSVCASSWICISQKAAYPLPSRKWRLGWFSKLCYWQLWWHLIHMGVGGKHRFPSRGEKRSCEHSQSHHFLIQMEYVFCYFSQPFIFTKFKCLATNQAILLHISGPQSLTWINMYVATYIFFLKNVMLISVYQSYVWIKESIVKPLHTWILWFMYLT